MSTSIQYSAIQKGVKLPPRAKNIVDKKIIPEGKHCLLCEPHSVHQAIKFKEWREAMDQEFPALKEQNTWDLVDLPPEKKPLGCKRNNDGSIDKCKARLVVDGSKQVQFIEYNETFAPVVRMETLRLLLGFGLHKKFNFRHVDISSAFLNGDLDEEVYIKQPLGYISKCTPG